MRTKENRIMALLAMLALASALSAQDIDCGGQFPVPDNLSLNAEFATSDPNLNVQTSGIWAVWWYESSNITADVPSLLNNFDSLRCDSLENFGLQDPPTPAAGRYVNIYLHDGDDDPFPAWWGNGVGTNRDGFPFMTLPVGAHRNDLNTFHEGFHIFQHTANSPGFEYRGDSAWFVESTAQYFAATRRPDNQNAFLEAASIEANPHLALWHSFDNGARGDEDTWYPLVRQYGLHTWLYYLTEDAEATPRSTITDGFYEGTRLLPQEYIANEVGLDNLRGHFADWAAANVSDFDYLTRGQVNRARQEPIGLGPEITGTANPLAGEWDAEGTQEFVRPTEGLEPRGWSYNVIRVDDPDGGDYRFAIEGDNFGSRGERSHFEARVVIQDGRD